MAMFPTYRQADPLDALLGNFMSGAGGRLGGGDLMRAPETDVMETEREIRVITEMPGLKRDDIEIDIENNVLTIRGEKREQRQEGEEGRYHISERRYGTFSRTFVLPRDVEADSIRATFEDGVLNVTVPKSERARRRRITVGGADGGPQQVEARSDGGEQNQERNRQEG